MRGRSGIPRGGARSAWLRVVVAVTSVAVGWGVGLTAAHVGAAQHQDQAASPYTVAALAQMVARAPTRWMGRTVRVQGVVLVSRQQRNTRDGWVLRWPPQLTDPGSQVRWPLAWGPPDPLLGRLRTVPLLGRVVSASQTISWGRMAIYRIQVRKAPGWGCPECDEAVLVDAAR